MKNLKTLLFSFLLLGMAIQTSKANTPDAVTNRNYDGNAYIFVEGSVEFSVFPDGQFDFVYVGPQNTTQVVVTAPGVNVSFNAGHDYEAYVQYDDYGAVIQVEEVPIYYDEYGRIIQAGTVDIAYNNRRLVRVGGLNIHYNHYGHYNYVTGFINPYNRIYVYRPWHVYYVRPIYASCVVWDIPYRRYYTPFRYSYYNHIAYYRNRHFRPYNNCRRDFYRPGSRIHYRNGRTAINRDFREGRTNTMVSNHGTSERALARTNAYKNNDRGTISRNDTRVDRNNTRGIGTQNNARTIRNNNANARGIARQNNSKVIPSTRGNTRGVAVQNNARTIRNNNANARGIARQDRPKNSTLSSNKYRGKAINNSAKSTSRYNRQATASTSRNAAPKARSQRSTHTSRASSISRNYESRKSTARSASNVSRKSGRSSNDSVKRGSGI